ncbi:DNA methyltransferase (plasmid) [Leuconostoc mesenteroides subsp. mesenteroides J18]|uniref:DNA adenine methylase n=1 Tax=Leuconostoc mesenteroides TaxID=1245 RepID=UPI00023408F4|nr:DNA adenine methylase [Leuconostoc mesenteroides]AET31282.1 DNA methyltransferase [Leuconostoc mesenteroides subsp. mesenteroides J18]AQU50263.1 DNA methyltransferase [Leuconostoc mesenteroides subsp. mesenteroides]AQU50305.1 DNA methyltransferase [Leuconostoc mesenteroides subsp. mesenteroides]
MVKNPLVKPFVKWAGGKRQLLPEIKKYIPQKINKYYEPFAGGGAVFLNMQFSKTTINDFNSELTNTYIVVKENVDELIEKLKVHQANNTSEYYYEIRSWDRSDEIKAKSDIERAARFIYLNKTGFNGLFRVNSQGQINVPYGRYKNPAIVNEEVLKSVSAYLNKAKVKILNGDYAKALTGVKSGDFIYLDPPYAPISDDKQSFVGYTLNGFNNYDQERLRNTFNDLTEKGAYVMMSNSSVPLIHELYADYADTTVIVKASRNINSKGSERDKVDEVLIMNYDYKNI